MILLRYICHFLIIEPLPVYFAHKHTRMDYNNNVAITDNMYYNKNIGWLKSTVTQLSGCPEQFFFF